MLQHDRLIPLADKSTTASAAYGGSVVTGVEEVTHVTGEMVGCNNGCMTMGSMRRMRNLGSRVEVVRVCDDDDDDDDDDEDGDNAAVCDGDKDADVSNDET